MKQYLDMLQHILDKGEDRTDRTGTGTRSVFGYQTRFDLAEGFPLLTTKKMFTKGIIHELLWFLAGDTNVEYLNRHGVHIWDEWAAKEDRCDVLLRRKGDLGPIYGKQWRSWPNIRSHLGNRKKRLFERFYDHIDNIPFDIYNGFHTRIENYKDELLGDRESSCYLDIGDDEAWIFGDLAKYLDEIGAPTEVTEVHFESNIDQLSQIIDQIKNTPDSRRIIVSAWNVSQIDEMALPPCHCLFQFYVTGDRRLSCQLYQR